MIRKLILENREDGIHCALLEDGLLAEYWRREAAPEHPIYLARVHNIMPNLQAAFVGIGEEKDAFLPLAEKGLEPVRQGQEVLVQVQRTPGGDKGRRVTRAATLPGRYLTLLTREPGILALSARIREPEERARLRSCAEALPKDVGWILRTAARDVGEAELTAEAEALLAKWEALQRRAKSAPAPSRLDGEDDEYADVRDLLALPLDEILLGGIELPPPIAALITELGESAPSVIASKEASPMEAEGAAHQLERALRRKVWLDCGGTLVFDYCEAMTVIDVNAGKYQGKGDMEQSLLRLNLEAAAEIARQLRLRDIGGIVVVDFVDMKSEAHRLELMRAMERAMEPDRARPVPVDLSALCLLQLTRRTMHRPLSQLFYAPCDACQGTGLRRIGKESG